MSLADELLADLEENDNDDLVEKLNEKDELDEENGIEEKDVEEKMEFDVTVKIKTVQQM